MIMCVCVRVRVCACVCTHAYIPFLCQQPWRSYICMYMSIASYSLLVGLVPGDEALPFTAESGQKINCK